MLSGAITIRLAFLSRKWPVSEPALHVHRQQALQLSHESTAINTRPVVSRNKRLSGGRVGLQPAHVFPDQPDFFPQLPHAPVQRVKQFAVFQRAHFVEKTDEFRASRFKPPARNAPVPRCLAEQKLKILEKRLGASAELSGQIKAVAQQLQFFGRKPAGFVRLPLERPALQGGFERAARVPLSYSLRIHRQRAQGNVIGLKLAVGIAQDTCNGVAQFQLPARIGTEVNAAQIVIVGVKIVPEEWLPPEHPLKVLNRIDGDGFGNDLRSSPENLDDGIQALAKLLQVIGMMDWT